MSEAKAKYLAAKAAFEETFEKHLQNGVEFISDQVFIDPEVEIAPGAVILPGCILRGKTVISTGMRHEEERCAAAVDAALAGRPTALVCSGDPGVYALAGLALETLEARDLLDRVPLNVVPGVPAVCAASWKTR